MKVAFSLWSSKLTLCEERRTPEGVFLRTKIQTHVEKMFIIFAAGTILLLLLTVNNLLIVTKR